MKAPPAALGKIAAALVWPDPRPDGKTVLSADTLRRAQVVIAGMVNYIDTQLARCKMLVDGQETKPTAPVLVP